MNKQRRASMLIELVLLMSAGSAIVLAAVMLTHRSFEMTSRFHTTKVTQDSLQRLSHSFRRDVHQAAQCLQGETELQLRLIRDDQSELVYEMRGESIVRAETPKDGVKRYEQFQLPVGAVVQWRIGGLDDGHESSTAPQMAWLSIMRPIAPNIEALRLEMHVGACTSHRSLSVQPQQAQSASKEQL